MPRYTYKCDCCGYVFDDFSTIAHRDNPQKCPECLGPSGRYLEAEMSGWSQKSGEHPRWSWSMACTEAQAKEVLPKHPELEADFKLGKQGGPLLIHNRADKLRKMKIFGMEEY